MSIGELFPWTQSNLNSENLKTSIGLNLNDFLRLAIFEIFQT